MRGKGHPNSLKHSAVFFVSLIVFTILFLDFYQYFSIVHECGHCIAAVLLGVPVRRITLGSDPRIYYAVDVYSEIHPLKLHAVSIAGGAASSLFFYVLLTGFINHVKPDTFIFYRLMYYSIKYFLFTSLIKGIFNMLIEGVFPLYYNNNLNVVTWFLTFLPLSSASTSYVIEVMDNQRGCDE